MPINFAVKAAATVALMAAQAALGAMKKIEGPRLDDLNTTTADYGTPLEDFWGRRLLAGRPVIWAEPLREKKKKSKTKGGKYAEYKYFGTWAVAIAGHPIDSVAKIYLDKRPVYQATGVGPLTALIIQAIDPAADDAVFIPLDSVKIYTGGQTSPDPRMDAWFDDKFGPNSCSALNGISYIVFKDIPLEKFGNRIPQVDVDAISAAADHYPYEVRATNYSLNNAQFSPDYTSMTAVAGGAFEYWDTPTRTKISGVATTGGSFAAAPGGFYALNAFFGQDLVFVSSGGAETVITDSSLIPVIMGDVFFVGGDVYTVQSGGGDAYLWAKAAIGTGFNVTGMFSDLSGSAIAVGISGSNVAFYDRSTAAGFSVTSPGAGNPYAMVNADGNYVVVLDSGETALVDPVAQTVLATGSVTVAGSIERQVRAAQPGRSSFWIGTSEYSSTDLSLIRTIDQNLFLGWGAIQGYLYDPISHAVIIKPLFTAAWIWLYVDRTASNGVPLQTIVEEDALRANCVIDGSDLDQIVHGYSVAPGPVKDRLAPLFDIHDSVLRLHDFTIQGLKRGTSSVGTILTQNFVRGEDRYVVETAQDNDLPMRIEVKFADKDHDQQVNVVLASRQTDAVDTRRVQPIDLTTYADDANGMQQKADRFLRVQWNMRSVVTNEITAQHLAAEAGDVYDLDLDGVLWTAELQRQTLMATSPSIKCEWRRTFPSLNSLGSNNGPGIGGYEDQDIFVPGPAQGFVLDIPLVTDADSSGNPFLYYGIGGMNVGIFPGASLSEAMEMTDAYSEVESVASTQEATWGHTTDALGSANPNLWDRGNTVNVRTYGTTLDTVTEAQIDFNPDINLAALRNPATGLVELLNFTTATLEIDGTYTLSGLKRGRRGTEGAIGSHAIGDEFILVSDLQKHMMGLSDVGEDWFYKAQTFGRDPDAGALITIDPFTGATLKPYAPARLKWTTDGTDLFGEIFRRTRIGGAWTGGSAIPLSENSEEYEVDILDGSGNVLRTITVSGTNTFTYTAAQIAADSGSVDTPPSANVYQLSDTVGRGFALAA